MGGGKDQKAANQMLQQTQQVQAQRESTANSRNQQDLSTSQGRGDDLYSSLRSGYGALAGGNSPGGAGGSSGGSGGGGGYAVPTDTRFRDVENMYRSNMGAEGGWDSGRLSRVTGDAAKMRSLGYDPESVNRMRGGGVPEEFAKTGGLSEADRANMRARGNSVVPAMYSRLRDEGNRMASVQGGYGPGQGAMMSRLSRQQVGAAQDAARDTELGITNQVNQGRQWGSGAMTSSEGALNSLRGSSLGQAADTERGVQSDISGNQKWGTQGLEARAESDRAAQIAAASAAASGSRFDQEMAFRRQMAGLGGLESLYGGSGSGEYNTNKQFDLANRGLLSDVGNTATQLKTNNKSAWDTVAQVGGGVLGAVAMSSRELKTDIKPLKFGARERLKSLPLYSWKYKGSDIKHIGPMAEDFKEIMGVGDGKTLHLADVMGSLIASAQEGING